MVYKSLLSKGNSPMAIYQDEKKIGNVTDKSKSMGSKEKGKVVNKEHWGKDSGGVNQTYVQEHKGKTIQSAGSADAQRTGDYTKVTKDVGGKEATNTAIDSAVDQMEETFDKTDSAHGGAKKLDKSGTDWGSKMSALKKCFGGDKMAKGDDAPPPPPPTSQAPLSSEGSQSNVSAFMSGLGKSEDDHKTSSDKATMAALKHRVANAKGKTVQDVTPEVTECPKLKAAKLAKGKIEIQPHPADVVDVDPKILAVMKHKLATSKSGIGTKKPIKDIMDDSVHYSSKKD